MQVILPFPSPLKRVKVCRVTVLNSHARELLQSDALAHVATTNPDGSPQMSCIWVGLDGDEIVSGHLDHRQKLSNVQRDPRVVVTVEGTRTNAMGLREYMIVQGRGRVENGGAADLLHRLAQVYVGPGAQFPPPEYTAPGYILRITPERVSGVGPWRDG